MTSARMEAKKANRWPYWTRRTQEAAESGPNGVATQWDLARTYIRKAPLVGDRGSHWRALALIIGAFNTRFTGAPATNLLGTEVLESEGRNADPERAVKATALAVNATEFAYDTARKYLRRIDDGDEQERNWRELESKLRGFNERFRRDTTRAIARMAASHDVRN